MKGLDISREFFLKWGLPFIRQKFPDLAERIAVGRFEGSDAIGADDELSCDHMWGPQFRIYMVLDDFKRVGKQFEEILNQNAPISFNGYSLKGSFDKPVFVESIDAFFQGAFPKFPENARDWLPCGYKFEVLDSWLYFLKHGSLFYDPLGEFSSLRKKLLHYPKDLLFLRMSQCCFDIAHYGEYNFCSRLLSRKDILTIQICLGYFVESVMRLCFLMNNDYSPYWKWLPHEFKKLPIAEVIGPKLDILTESIKLEKKVETVNEICFHLGELLIEKQFVRNDIENPFYMPWFYVYTQELKKRIQDPEVIRIAFFTT